MSKKGYIGYHFNGLKELKKELVARANSSDVQSVVKRNTTKVQQQSMANASSVYIKGYSQDNTKKAIGIDFGNNGWAGRVTMGMKYNEYTEKGTRFMAAEPLLKPVFNKQKTVFKSDLEKLLK